MVTGHRLRRALLAGVRASAHTQRLVNGELVLCLVEGQTEQDRCANSARVTPLVRSSNLGWSGENNVFVSCRDRVTKVAPASLRKAGVPGHMSWDITMKKKTLFENASDGDNISWEDLCSTNLVNFLT